MINFELRRNIPVLVSLVLLFGLANASTLHAQAPNTGVVNLVTSTSGMHRVYYRDLLDQGIDLKGFKHRQFSLVSNGNPVGVRTKGQDPQNGKKRFFGPGGYIEFYAQAANNRYSSLRTTTLHYRGSRTQIKTHKNRFDKDSAVSSQYIQSDTYDGNDYFDYLAASDQDPFHYGQTFIYTAGDTQGPSISFDLPNLVNATANIEVEVYGLRDWAVDTNDHHIVAKVNGAEVGDEQFDGFSLHTMSVNDVPVALNSNTFTLYGRSIADVPFDAIGLNKMKVNYWRETVAIADYIEGWIDAKQVEVSGFTSKSVSVYRRNGDGTVDRISGLHKKNGKAYFNTGGVAGHYIVVGPNGYKKPTFSLINDDADIRSGSAEYLIITHSSFAGDALNKLVTMRQAEYDVKVVDVEQIYGQFGIHQPSAKAIRDYIKFAERNLDTRFVTFVGSDTYDYKNYLSDSISFIPTNYVMTKGGALDVQQTPSDALYGDVDGDQIPDIPVGRLSVRTKDELAQVVDKIEQYQIRSDYSAGVLFAADKGDAGNSISFTSDVEAMLAVMPEEWSSGISDEYLALPDIDGDQAAHDKTISALNSGVLVAAYIGHSSQQIWGRTTPAMLRTSEIPNLTNFGKPALVTQWGCWNAFFVDPGGNSMADVFLNSGSNGAVTVLGASTLTTASGERKFGIELNKRMFAPGITIGEAVVAAKQAFALKSPSNSGIILGWQIIGDPALKINPAQ